MLYFLGMSGEMRNVGCSRSVLCPSCHYAFLVGPYIGRKSGDTELKVVVPKAIDKDVWGGLQELYSNRLIDSCEAVISKLNNLQYPLNAHITSVQKDFKGYFAEVFDRNAKVQAQDKENLVAALEAVVTGLRAAQEAAKREQRRIDKAREWEAARTKWENEKPDGGIGEAFYKWFNSEPKLDPSYEKGDTPPQIQAPAVSTTEHKLPEMGTRGRCSTSAAMPDSLDGFVKIAESAHNEIRFPAKSLQLDYQDFEAAWTWKSGSVAVPGFSALATSCVKYSQAYADDARWVSIISAAFKKAGKAGEVVSLPDQALAAALAAGKVDPNRKHVEIPAVSLSGMVPTTGYAADPINTATGNFVEPECDLSFSGAASTLGVRRMYNSIVSLYQRQERTDAPAVGVFGYGWSSALDQQIVFDDERAVWISEDGRQLFFPRNGDTYGRATADNYWLGLALPGQGHFCTELLPEGVAAWVIADNAGGRYFFDQQGRWLGMASRDGDAIRSERDTDGAITRVVHQRGRSIAYEYCDGLLVVAHASDGRRVEYVYEQQRLISVVSGMGTRTYSWNDAGIIDKVTSAAGVVECVNTYDDEGRVLTQVSEFGRTTKFTYLSGGLTVVSDLDGDRPNTWISDVNGRTVGVIDSDNQRTSMSYDKHGNLVLARGRDGKATVHFYDDRGHITRTVLPSRGELTYQWDEHDRLVTTVAENGSVVSFDYGSLDSRDPVRIIDPCGGVSTLEWDAGLLRRVVDPVGVTIELSYDEAGDLIATTNSNGDTARLIRDHAGRIVKAISPLGNTTHFSYNDAGLLVALQDAEGARWKYTHDAAGRITAVTDPYGYVTSYSYGAHGQVEAVTDPLGRVTRRDFDDLGNVRAVRLPDGAEYLLSHDALSRLRQVTDPTGAQWRQEYDVEGRPNRSIDPMGSIRSVIGDPMAGVMTAHSADGTIDTKLEFDRYGRPVKSIDAADDASMVVYDAAGRPVELLDADGGLTLLVRDLAGRVVERRSAEGRRTCYEYDQCGRLLAVIDPAGGRASVTYDADSRVVGLTAPNGEQSRFEYDRCGRVIRSVVPGRGVGVWAYDKCGRVTYSRDLIAGIRRFSYDAAGQLVKAINGAGGVTNYRYDECGRAVERIDPAGGVARRVYDAAGRVASVTDPLGRTTTITYDAAGRRVAQVNPDGVEWRFEYDAAGRQSTVYANGRVMSRIERNLAGRTVTLSNAAASCEDFTQDILTYDRVGRLVNRCVTGRDGVIRRWQWSYDRDGLRLSYRNAAGVVTEYERDDAGRVSAVVHPSFGRVEFGYDESGRLTSCVGAELSQSWVYRDGFVSEYRNGDVVTCVERGAYGFVTAVDCGQQRVLYSYDDAGQLVRAVSSSGETRSWQYDAAGRVTTAEVGGVSRQLSYDVAGQLVESRSGQNISWYRYDLLGRRVEQRDSDGALVSLAWSERGWLSAASVRCAAGIERELDVRVDALGCLAAVNGVELDWDIAGGLPQLSSVGGDAVLSLLGGALLTSAGVLGSGWRADVSDPYSQGAAVGVGGFPAGAGLSAAGRVQLFGLEWMGSRLYDPSSLGFLTPDPLAAPAGSVWEGNPYNFVAGNPLSLLDPAGLSPITDDDLSVLTNYNANRQLSLAGGVEKFINDHPQVVGTVMLVAGVAIMCTGVGGGAGLALAAASGALLAGGSSVLAQGNAGEQIELSKLGQEMVVGAVVGFVTAGTSNMANSLLLKGSATAQQAVAAHAGADTVRAATNSVRSMFTNSTQLARAMELEAKTNTRALWGNFLRQSVSGAMGTVVGGNVEYVGETAFDPNVGLSFEGWVAANVKAGTEALTGVAARLGVAGAAGGPWPKLPTGGNMQEALRTFGLEAAASGVTNLFGVAMDTAVDSGMGQEPDVAQNGIERFATSLGEGLSKAVEVVR